MTVRTNALAVAVALPLLMAASGCAKPAEAPPTATSASPAAQAPAGGGTDLAALVPIPANTKTTKGPDPLSENGVHQYFEVALHSLLFQGGLDGGGNDCERRFDRVRKDMFHYAFFAHALGLPRAEMPL